MKDYEEAQQAHKDQGQTSSGEQVTLQSYFSSKKYGSTDPRQVQAVDALMPLIAEQMLPLSIVEAEAFRNFTQALDSRFAVQ